MTKIRVRLELFWVKKVGFWISNEDPKIGREMAKKFSIVNTILPNEIRHTDSRRGNGRK